MGVCEPYWLIDVPFWMSVNVTVLGVSPMDLANNTNVGVNVLRNQITTNSMEGFISSEKLANTTIGRFTYSSTSSVTVRRLSSNLRSLQGLSVAADASTMSSVLVAADTFSDASALSTALVSNTPRVAFAIENTLREQGLLSAHDVVISPPIVLSAAAAGTSSGTPPLLITTTEPPVILPITAAPDISSPVAAMSAGAIAGIAIGAIVFAAFVGALALVAVRAREAQETERLRLEEISRLAQEQARTLALTAAAGTALPVAAAPTLIRVSRAAESRTKETFQPTQAGEIHSETPLSPTSATTGTTTDEHVPILTSAPPHVTGKSIEIPASATNEAAANTSLPIVTDITSTAAPETVEIESSSIVTPIVKKEEGGNIPLDSSSDVGSIGSNTTDSIGSNKTGGGVEPAAPI